MKLVIFICAVLIVAGLCRYFIYAALNRRLNKSILELDKDIADIHRRLDAEEIIRTLKNRPKI